MPCNQLSQIQQVKTTHIYYLLASVGQEYGHGLDGSSASGFLSGHGEDASQGCGVIRRHNWGRIHFQAHMVAGRIQSLAACWIQGLSSFHLLVGGLPQFLASGHLRWAAHSVATCSIKAIKGESDGQIKVVILCDIITKVTFLLYSIS